MDWVIVGGRIMISQDDHVVIPGPCEYVTLPGKKHFATDLRRGPRQTPLGAGGSLPAGGQQGNGPQPDRWQQLYLMDNVNELASNCPSDSPVRNTALRTPCFLPDEIQVRPLIYCRIINLCCFKPLSLGQFVTAARKAMQPYMWKHPAVAAASSTFSKSQLTSLNQKTGMGASLVVQWLRLHASPARGTSLIPGWGT